MMLYKNVSISRGSATAFVEQYIKMDIGGPDCFTVFTHNEDTWSDNMRINFHLL